ncbi:hypothetical protein [Sporosarcina sp. D27]|uniref:hypothetical protein n=1 Tax=Sporosarcina sp. D27 TaxID=1382305 RepID=UPI0004B7970F|nr:hypothetical protein [Sporosarcina sp. D27]
MSVQTDNLKKIINNGHYQNTNVPEEKGLYCLDAIPSFRIGQTAYIIQNKEFNLLKD